MAKSNQSYQTPSKSVHAVKRTPFMRENDLLEVARQYLAHRTLQQISDWIKLNRPYTLSITQIHFDIAELKKRWREAAKEDVEARLAQELRRIDEIEREAKEAWERSRQQSVRTTQERVERPNGKTAKDDATRVQIVREEHVGDPRFLDIVMNCVTQRCRLLGINPALRIEQSGPDGGPIQVESETHGLTPVHVDKVLQAFYVRRLSLSKHTNGESGNGEKGNGSVGGNEG